MRNASRWALIAITAVVIAALTAVVPAPRGAGAAGLEKVLILSTTVSGGIESIEAQEAIAQGFGVDVMTPTAWGATSAAEFAAYRAIILGDATCGGSKDAAEANATTWGPEIDGNVIIIGTDPVYHSWSGGEEVTRKGIDFAVAEPGKTGAYITLSCYYDWAAPHTPVPLLDGISPGGFEVTSADCYNNAHIVATHDALTGLTDATLSNWSCSVHEAFDKWPGDFTVLAIARDFGSAFTASDGTVGTPYILASGVRALGLSLSPVAADAFEGATHTVTAELLNSDDLPVAGATIGFGVTLGPDMGATGTCAPVSCVTGDDGKASFTFTNTGGLGSDTITAWVDQPGVESPPNGVMDPGEPRTTAGVTWTPGSNDPPAFVAPTPAEGTELVTDAGQPVTFNTRAEDPNAGDIAILNITGMPASATYNSVGLNPVDATFAWTPPAAAGGIHPLTLTVADQRGLAGPSRHLTIRVKTVTQLAPNPAVANVPPSLSPNIGLGPDGLPHFGFSIGGVFIPYLSAQLKSTAGTSIANKPVYFKTIGALGTSTCARMTQVDGYSVCDDREIAIAAVLNGGYTASFAGDSLNTPSSGAAGLLGGVPL